MGYSPSADLRVAALTKVNKPAFASFWHGGNLTPYEVGCIQSFLAQGYDFTVYSYDEVANLPSGTRRGNAAEIADRKYLDSFMVGGKPSITHFTDYFRIALFQKTDLIWADVDIVLIGDFSSIHNGTVIGYETRAKLCNAVLRLDRNDPRLKKTLDSIASMAGQNLFWGATGPRLLTRFYGDVLTGQAHPPKIFYPIHYNDYYKPFLGEYRAECEEKCKEAVTLHLWNNLVEKTGIWKQIGPPKESYLYQLFKNTGAERNFKEFYPDKVMRTMVDNAVVHAGPDAGIKKVLKFLVPAIRNSIMRRV